MSTPNCNMSNCPCITPCPMKNAMDVLGGKWKIPILCALRNDGPLRYSELKRKINGITNTMLASSLKELEKAGLVLRTQYEEMPVRVEYSVTDVVEPLVPAFQIIGKWSKSLIQSKEN